MRNALRDLEVGILSRLYAFARGRLADLSSGQSWATAGRRVFHQKFGTGVVLLTQGHKLTVSFDGVSAPKRVVDAFCEPVFDAFDQKSPKAIETR